MGHAQTTLDADPDSPVSVGSLDTLATPVGLGGEELAPGSALGRYVILETLGRGGMGAVYAAFDPKLDRRVALKVMLPTVGKPSETTEGRSRLLREAQALAKVSHPYVVHVHDVGTFGEQIYIAMEHLSGVTLRDWLDASERTWEDVLRVMIRAGRGLAAAHEAGLVHRDFKPDNVLVDEGRRPHVVDFGLARAVDVDDADADIPDARPSPESSAANESAAISQSSPDSGLLGAQLTKAGALIGTPAYMSPEQIHRLAIDARSDQFSFCVTLFEALYGKRPFEAQSVQEQLHRTVHAAFPPAPRGTRVPKRFHRILERGLSPQPAKRFASMDALLEALSEDPGLPRRRVAMVAGIVGLLGVSFFVGRALDSSSPTCEDAREHLSGVWDADKQKRVADAFTATDAAHAGPTLQTVTKLLDRYANEWTGMHRDACEATAVRREQSERVLELRMACLARQKRHLQAVTAELEKADRKTLEHAVQAASSLPAVSQCEDPETARLGSAQLADPEARRAAEALELGLAETRAAQLAGRFREAADAAAELEAGATELAVQGLRAEAALLRAEAELGDGQYDAAAEAFETATLAAEASGHDDVLAKARGLAGTTIGYHLAKPEEGRRQCRHAEAITERLGRPPALSGRSALCHHFVSVREGKYEDARDHAVEAKKLFEEAYGPDHPMVAKALNSAGIALYRLGNDEEALASFERSKTIWETIGGPDHPHVASPLVNIGILHRRRAEFDEAIATYERVERIYLAAHGPDHPALGKLHNNLAVVFNRLGKYDEALERYEESYRIKLAAHGDEHPSIGVALLNLGVVHKRLGQDDKALDFYERSLAVKEKTLGKNHVRLTNVHIAIALVCSDLGQHERAVETARRAVAIRQESPGKDDVELPAALTTLGDTLVEAGEPRNALEPLERAMAIREKYEKDPSLLGSTRFSLGKALWESKKDRERGLALVERAEQDFIAAGPGQEENLKQLRAWMKER